MKKFQGRSTEGVQYLPLAVRDLKFRIADCGFGISADRYHTISPALVLNFYLDLVEG